MQEERCNGVWELVTHIVMGNGVETLPCYREVWCVGTILVSFLML